MNGEDRDLYALGEMIQPDDPEASACWRILLRGLMAGYLQDADDLKQIEDFIASPGQYSDIGVEELMFERHDGRLRVSLLDDAAECDAAKFSDELAKLVGIASRTK
jgi:hypothetical protein